MKLSKRLKSPIYVIRPIDLLPYCNDKECYFVVESIAAKYPILEQDAGFFIDRTGEPADHAWLVAPDGTIIDPTHSQFNPRIKLLLAKPGTPVYRRYYSWRLHHNPHCLHKLLNVPYKCEAPGCRWDPK